ncbi:MAG: hypothetical protein WDO15_23365 [Bacteroidota bacterium]
MSTSRKNLFPKDHEVFQSIDAQFDKITLGLHLKGDFDMVYDQVVSLGEVISTIILCSIPEERLQY